MSIFNLSPLKKIRTNLKYTKNSKKNTKILTKMKNTKMNIKNNKKEIKKIVLHISKSWNKIKKRSTTHKNRKKILDLPNSKEW